MKKRYFVLALAVATSVFSTSVYAGEFTDEAAVEVEMSEEGFELQVDHTDGDGQHIHNDATGGTVVTKPTCTETGLKRYNCTDPDVPNKTWVHEEIIPALGHDWNKQTRVITKMPTCTKEGEAQLKCSRCDAVCTEVLPANVDPNGTRDDLHSWDKWVVEKAPTCTAEGSQIRWCSACGAKEVADIPATGAQFKLVNQKLKDCYTLVRSYVCESCNGKVAGHKYDDEIDTVSHYVAEIDAKPYLYKTVNPTCEEDGYKLYVCKYNHATKFNKYATDDDVKAAVEEGAAKKVVIPATGHTWSKWVQRYAPGEQGNEYGYWVRTCSVCKKTEEKIAKEDPNKDVVVEPVKNGLNLDADGTVKYYKDGEFDATYNGFAEFNGSRFFTVNGVVDTSIKGLQLYNGVFYYLNDGQLLDKHTGITMYGDEFFYVDGGALDTTQNGLIDYNGETFVIAAGRILSNLNGPWMSEDGTCYFVSYGQIAKGFTGTTIYEGKTYEVENGKLICK